MISVPDTLLQRAAVIVLTLYSGAFLGQALCVLHPSELHPSELHPSDMESQMGTSMDGHVAHGSAAMALPGSASTAMPRSLSTAMPASSSMAAHSPSQHRGHSGTPGPNHSGVCAVMACGSAVTTTPDNGLGPMSRVSSAQVAYLGGGAPPETDMVPPPPRSG